MASTLAIQRSSIGWSIGLSILMIVAGLAAIAFSPLAGIATEVLVAWLLVISAGFHFVLAWHTRQTRGLLWELLLGVVYAVAGIYLLLRPMAGLVALTLALAIYRFVESALEFALAFRLRPMAGSGWLLVDAIVTLLLAFMIWRTWPWSTVWAIGILVGVSMLFSGISRLMLALATRQMVANLP
jgi:uncharacterized membrane protein HdeD (DUF308 family)